MNNETAEYVAALCHMRKGDLVPFVYERFTAPSNAEAAARARRWAKSTVGLGLGKTWLQVTLDGASIYSEELRTPQRSVEAWHSGLGFEMSLSANSDIPPGLSLRLLKRLSSRQN